MDAAEGRTEKRPQSRARRARTRTKLEQTATQDAMRCVVTVRDSRLLATDHPDPHSVTDLRAVSPALWRQHAPTKSRPKHPDVAGLGKGFRVTSAALPWEQGHLGCAQICNTSN
ncbi:hypothetical protein RRG08_025988 [Elysia crispata]|uniref:Uncharacterized protein n=1 Tax=Elysia crispata TaxID=231223 RepID=A0AAE0ZGG9_9GAST|nr:hypothetical protein RRG08_025988 [Elysia crispata]